MMTESAATFEVTETNHYCGCCNQGPLVIVKPNRSEVRRWNNIPVCNVCFVALRNQRDAEMKIVEENSTLN